MVLVVEAVARLGVDEVEQVRAGGQDLAAAEDRLALLRALGYDEENAPGFMEAFVREFDFLEDQWEKEREVAPTQDEALVEIYKRARPGEPPSVDSARNYFRTAFFENRRYDLSRVGRYKLNRKLGPELDRLEEVFGLELEKPDLDQSVLSPAEVEQLRARLLVRLSTD